MYFGYIRRIGSLVINIKRFRKTFLMRLANKLPTVNDIS